MSIEIFKTKVQVVQVLKTAPSFGTLPNMEYFQIWPTSGDDLGWVSIFETVPHVSVLT